MGTKKRSRSSAIASTSSKRQSHGSTKTRKGPKPTQEIVEIPSDEEDSDAEVHTRGPLRGLTPNSVLKPPSTQPTVELSDDDDDFEKDPPTSTQQPAHSTRAARYGRAAVNYDMKYHPMDEVTRPKRTANRRSGSRSASASTKREVAGDTSDESEMSDAKDSDDAAESDGEEGSIDAGFPGATQRAPDPKATRHSVRFEAQKSVNYSRKHHPRDHGLPGYQHNAKHCPPVKHTPSKISTKRKVIEDSDANGDTEPDDNTLERAKSSAKPRKALKSLSSSSPTTMKAKEKSQKQLDRKQQKANPDTMNTDDIDAFVDDILQRSIAPAAVANGDNEVFNSCIDDGCSIVTSAERSTLARSDTIGMTDGLQDDAQAVASMQASPQTQSREEDSFTTSGFEDGLDHGEMNHGFQDGYNTDHEPSSAHAAVCQTPTRATADPQVIGKVIGEGKQPLTPPSETRLVIVKPYSTGYKPTYLDPRDLQQRHPTTDTTLYPSQHTFCPTQIDSTLSSSSAPPDAATVRAEETRKAILMSCKARTSCTPIGSPQRRLQSDASDIQTHANPSSSTLVGASGTVSKAPSRSLQITGGGAHGDPVAVEPNSDFEEQLAMTELPAYHREEMREVQRSDASYGDLPVSQRERSDDVQATSSLILSTPPIDGVVSSSMPPTQPSSPSVEHSEQLGHFGASSETPAEAVISASTRVSAADPIPRINQVTSTQVNFEDAQASPQQESIAYAANSIDSGAEADVEIAEPGGYGSSSMTVAEDGIDGGEKEAINVAAASSEL